MGLMAFHPLFLQWLPLLLLLLPILCLFLLKQKNTQKKIPNLPPRPPTLPIIGNLHQIGGKAPHHSLWKLSQKYGPIMLLKLGQVPTLVISSSEMAKEVLKTHDHQCCSRPPTEGSRRLSYNFLDVTFSPYSDYWSKMRKICVSELLSSARVRSYRLLRKQEMTRFINLVSEASPNAINLSENVCSLIGTIVRRIGCGGTQFECGKPEDAIKEAMTMLGSFSAADFFPSFGWIVDVLTGFHARREKCFRDFDQFFQRVLDEHLDPSRPIPEHEDIIDVMIQLSEDQSIAGGLTKDHIKAVLMNVFLGGINTSAITIVWAMTELSRNPPVMKKLQAEIRTCVGKKAMVEESDIENLHYLKLVVKETLRLHPPAVLLLPHETMVQCKIGGYDVHPKTRIHVNAWAINRDPRNWKEPEEFIPERFENGCIDFKGQHFEFLTFGAGRRICPGLVMGTTNVEFVLANLLYCFDWGLPSGMKIEDISLEEEGTFTVYRKLPLYLVPIKLAGLEG
ncbi:cytochrome P450 71B10-like [Cornus florida]|uniref:cytochrome P450 71B10-like n=1 Tax=Cornus florida TaxID=4283 RepID=UPI00289C0EF8|nr:cytochrome P450 71B10-like [Cornus florida]